jgi:tRNA threonylcarbamoyladenosine biosynthesis protein TsaE
METFLKKNFRKGSSFITNSSAETVMLASEFAGLLKPGDTVALSGNLGAGKTHFVKGVAAHFKVKKSSVVSPTFNLMKEYKGKDMMIYHFDFYRLENFDGLEKIGYRDYITDPDAIVLAEWPDRVRETWKDFNWAVLIAHLGGDKRKITIYRKK